ncbi:MAG: efflux RND transporter periplasmic adaptor subunit [Sulfurimonas sp.]|jgi:RND family efflux transporter MFP subunit
MKTWKKYLIALSVLAVVAVAFYFKVYIPKTTFETLAPKIGSLNVQVFGIGTVDAKNIYPINAQTGGKILDIFTDEGMWVKKGDLLVTIDSVDLPLQLEEAKASLAKAKHELSAVKKELESLISQKTLIQINYDRYEKLFAQKYAAKVEYDKAKADLQNITAQIEASYAHIDSSSAEITRVQKSIEALETKLSRLNIYAPIDGFVISKDAETSQTVLPSQPIVTMVDTKTVWIKAFVDEQISGTVRVAQEATITLRSQSNKTFKGKVERISAKSDAVTQEREIDISFDTLPTPFYINEQAQVSITTEVFNALFIIDAGAVVQNSGKTGVWISKDSKAHFLELSIVARSNSLVGVKSGVDESTKIIVLNPNKKPLSEGMTIHHD